MYRLEGDRIIRISDGAAIPASEGNGDYLNYLSWLSEGNMPAVAPPPSLSTAKTQVKAKIKLRAAQLRDQLIGPVSPGETAAWISKEQQARAYQTSQEGDDAPMLVAEAQVRGVSVSALATIIINNAEQFRSLEAQIAGKRGAHDDAIDALTDVEDVLSYDWTANWL